MQDFLNFQLPGTGWQYGVPTSTSVGTTTAKAGQIALTLFDGFFALLMTILPYGIGILIFYIGWNLARRALSGR